MACDICGKTGTQLVGLLSIYRTDDIQQVCSECETVIDRQLRKIQTMTGRIQQALLKRFMRNRKDQR